MKEIYLYIPNFQSSFSFKATPTVPFSWDKLKCFESHQSATIYALNTNAIGYHIQKICLFEDYPSKL